MYGKTEARDPGHSWSLAWNSLEGKSEEYPGAYLMRQLACLGDNAEKVKSTISPGEKEAARQQWWDRQQWHPPRDRRQESGRVPSSSNSAADQPPGAPSSDALEDPAASAEATPPPPTYYSGGGHVFSLSHRTKVNHKAPNFIHEELRKLVSFIYQRHKTHSFLFLSEDWCPGLEHLWDNCSSLWCLWPAWARRPLWRLTQEVVTTRTVSGEGSQRGDLSRLAYFIVPLCRLLRECRVMLSLTSRWHRVTLPNSLCWGPFYYCMLSQRKIYF